MFWTIRQAKLAGHAILDTEADLHALFHRKASGHIFHHSLLERLANWIGPQQVYQNQLLGIQFLFFHKQIFDFFEQVILLNIIKLKFPIFESTIKISFVEKMFKFPT